MIRNLQNAYRPIEARHWHTDAMEKQGGRRHIEDEFRARAEAELKKISK